jgi:hypothetical protein
MVKTAGAVLIAGLTEDLTAALTVVFATALTVVFATGTLWALGTDRVLGVFKVAVTMIGLLKG